MEPNKVTKPGLPPIHMIVIPDTATKSGMIRWLSAMGWTVKDIAGATNIRYQMVRNIVTTEPKRAAREDSPPLVLVYKEEPDIIESALDGALDASLGEGRKERKAEEKADRRELKQGVQDQDEDV